MEWAEQFYTRQGEWTGVYAGDVTERDRERVTAIERLAGPGVKRLLELGAGGGQSAAAAADLGHSVTAVELVARSAANAERLASHPRAGPLAVMRGDFYTIALEGPFDAVCYWDGFGVGADADQQRLLRRIARWLAPGGCALLDIYTPWYWSRVAGLKMRFGQVIRRYDFDPEGCRMLDRWWPDDDASQAVTQSLRCYSPADLSLLLQGTGLALRALEPGGAMDYERQRYTRRVPLGQAMQYLAALVPG